MIERLMRLLYCALILSALTAAPARAYVIEQRWSSTATNPSTGSMGTPVTVTWSLAPDGTLIPGNAPNTQTPSNLISFLDGTFGAGPGGNDLTQRPWFALFNQSFSRLSAVSGLTIVYEPHDDGVSSPRNFSNSSSARGILGVRGDMRLGGKSYGGTNTLASNFFPNYGEMMINTDQGAFFNNSANNYRAFRNVLMHEAMHGLGVNHVESSDARILVEPVISSAFDGPQLDDILALHRLYGDSLEKNGGNDSFSSATPLGTLSELAPLIRGTLGDSTVVAGSAVDFVSIDDDSDADYFSFTLEESWDVAIELSPKGAAYQIGAEGQPQSPYDARSLNNLSLALFNANGNVQIGATADVNGAGFGESILQQLGPGTYFARVRGTLDDVQLYQLSIAVNVTAPDNLVWSGGNGVWDLETTANFLDGALPSVFSNQDNVVFDDTAAATTVSIVADVAPGDVVVHTDGYYVFTGPGGIVAGSLTISGDGVVELANSGNSYVGPTQVLAGTLRIVGDANSMASPITVAAGGTLVLDPADAANMTSTISVQAGGVLEVGAPTTSGNVLPDSPVGIVNDGLMRVFDSEVIRNLSGAGALALEHEVSELAANAGFHGNIYIRSGATASVLDNAALGSAFGQTTVESGGVLATGVNLALGDHVILAGNGDGSGALRVADGSTLVLNGALSVASVGATVNVGAASTLGVVGDVASVAGDLTLVAGANANILLLGSTNLSGALVKAGPGRANVTGATTLDGPTIVSAGLLQLAGAGELTGEFHVAEGAALEISGDYMFSAASVLSGNGEIFGDINTLGAIAPGSTIGSLGFAGDLTLGESAVTRIQIGGSQPGVGYDQLTVAGQVMLDGALELSLVNGFEPIDGSVFTVLHGGDVTGAFAAYELPQLGEGLSWHVTTSPNIVALSVSAAVSYDPADFNEDGIVDADDLDSWQAGFGQLGAASHAQGDANGDNVVDGTDFLIWQRRLSGAPGLASLARATPEPGAAALYAAALIAFLAWRPRSLEHVS